MSKTLYRGTCTSCGTVKLRCLSEPWVGSFDEDFFGADCPSCGVGSQILMDPVNPELEAIERQLAGRLRAA